MHGSTQIWFRKIIFSNSSLGKSTSNVLFLQTWQTRWDGFTLEQRKSVSKRKYNSPYSLYKALYIAHNNKTTKVRTAITVTAANFFTCFHMDSYTISWSNSQRAMWKKLVPLGDSYLFVCFRTMPEVTDLFCINEKFHPSLNRYRMQKIINHFLRFI